MATWKKILVAGANATTDDITATEITVDVANDSFALTDNSDSNVIARDKIADVVAAIAGTALTSSNGVMAVSGVTTSEIAAGTLVIESEGIANNDNDTTIATCAAIKDFVDTQVAAGYDLDVTDGTTSGAIANNETLEIGGTANEVTVAYDDSTSKFTISLPNDVITSTLDLTGAGGITLQNDETITNATNGTVLINGELAAGTGSAAGVFKSNGNHDVTLKTGNATTGTITITDGANGNIAITPNGTGEVDISKVDIDGGAIDGTAIGANSASTGKFTTLETTGNATIAGNLTVTGTTTTVESTNLLVDDTFISLNDNAAVDADTGIVFGGANNKVFAWDNTAGRFSMDLTGGDASTAGGGLSSDGFFCVAHSGAGTPAGTDDLAVAGLEKIGNIYVDTSDGDAIYIYS